MYITPHCQARTGCSITVEASSGAFWWLIYLLHKFKITRNISGHIKRQRKLITVDARWKAREGRGITTVSPRSWKLKERILLYWRTDKKKLWPFFCFMLPSQFYTHPPTRMQDVSRCVCWRYGKCRGNNIYVSRFLSVSCKECLTCLTMSLYDH